MFGEDTRYRVLFRDWSPQIPEIQSELLGPFSSKKTAVWCFGVHLKGPLFGAGMFRLCGH
jgi:hypothetical protein